MPTKPKGDPAKVPHYSSNDIELKAEEVIRFFNPHVLASARPTPIRDFALETKRRFNVGFRDDLILGAGKGGRMCLGQFRTSPRAIFVDASLKDTDRFPFVLAHEYGHLVLHRHIDPDKCGYSTASIDDTEIDFVTLRKNLRTPRDWIEWQANRFASAVLMPRATFVDAVIDYQRGQGATKNWDIIFVADDASSQRALSLTLSHLATLFAVNKTNVECRLRDLERIYDQRNQSTRHISQLLKEE